MDSIYNNTPTKSLNGVASPVNMQQLTVDPTQATLMRYLRGGAPITPSSSVNSSRSSNSSFRRSLSPLSATETAKSSPSAYRTPVKMIEEDVLVMDGILVASAPGVRASRSSTSSSSNSSGSSTNHASVAGSSLSCSSGERSMHKTELCVAWEDFGQCRFGSNCQFAHGKEELHPTRFSVKNKSEAHACKTYPSGSSSHGKNYPLLPLVLMEAASQKASPTREPEYPCKSTSFTAASPECSSKNASPIATPEPLGRTSQAIIPGGYKKRPATVSSPGDSRTLVTTSETLVTTSECWSPLDDGIMVALPAQSDKYSSSKDVDACIESALYGPTRKKRLPVFTEFCPDN